MSLLPAQPEKILFIVGPTATGKTSLGLRLAKKFGGEIVSADSRQVYRGMDIGTGKDLSGGKFEIPDSRFQNIKQMITLGYYSLDHIPIWLLDLIDPDYRFSVADYLDAAVAVIDDIRNRGKLPIVVGGTGFYVKALLEGVPSAGVKPDWDLRRELSGYQAIELFKYLEKIDPERSRRMNASDRANPRRLIRALEIAKSQPQTADSDKLIPSRVLLIGLKASLPFLYQKIDRRVEERVEAGLLEEIRELTQKGFTWTNSALGSTLGYREWQPYFEKARTKDQRLKTVQIWKYHEHAYARRQLTWFRKVENLHWFDIGVPDWENQVERFVSQWYNAS